MKMHSTIEIERPADEVFALLSDFSRNPEWQSGMVSCEWTSEPPIAVGSTYEQVAHFMTRDIKTSFEVTALEPGRSISIESRESSFPIQVTRSVEPLSAERCRVTADVSGDPGRMTSILERLFGGRAQRSIQEDYQRLKALLEG